MQRDVAYRVNAPQVIGETIEGELVMINLARGTYYSTDGVGATIWELVQQGLPLGKVVTAACAAYAASPGEVAPAVERFLERLVDEQLVVPAEGVEPQPVEQVSHASEVQPFAPPVLNVYADMADILLLDPVHDVDESGWPRPKSAAEDR